MGVISDVIVRVTDRESGPPDYKHARLDLLNPKKQILISFSYKHSMPLSNLYFLDVGLPLSLHQFLKAIRIAIREWPLALEEFDQLWL